MHNRTFHAFPGVVNVAMEGSKLHVFLTDNLRKIGPVIKTFEVYVQNGSNRQFVDFTIEPAIFWAREIIKPFRYAVFSDSRYPIWYADFGKIIFPGDAVVVVKNSESFSVDL